MQLCVQQAHQLKLFLALHCICCLLYVYHLQSPFPPLSLPEASCKTNATLGPRERPTRKLQRPNSELVRTTYSISLSANFFHSRIELKSIIFLLALQWTHMGFDEWTTIFNFWPDKKISSVNESGGGKNRGEGSACLEWRGKKNQRTGNFAPEA